MSRSFSLAISSFCWSSATSFCCLSIRSRGVRGLFSSLHLAFNLSNCVSNRFLWSICPFGLTLCMSRGNWSRLAQSKTVGEAGCADAAATHTVRTHAWPGSTAMRTSARTDGAKPPKGAPLGQRRPTMARAFSMNTRSNRQLGSTPGSSDDPWQPRAQQQRLKEHRSVHAEGPQAVFAMVRARAQIRPVRRLRSTG
jgi:hypothetical protein